MLCFFIKVERVFSFFECLLSFICGFPKRQKPQLVSMKLPVFTRCLVDFKSASKKFCGTYISQVSCLILLRSLVSRRRFFIFESLRQVFFFIVKGRTSEDSTGFSTDLRTFVTDLCQILIS